MAKVRFIADEERIVPWLMGITVKPDQVVVIPDSEVESYICQPSVWELIEEKAPIKRAAGKGE